MHHPPAPSPGREALLDDLNPGQREAVRHAGTPLLVVAGAGTGKTRVLTRRVAWLVAGGLPPWSLLAITFTNKAAAVLRERLGGLPGSGEVMAGTFHRFGAWLLRRHGEAIGIDPRFTILDREDQLRLVKTIVSDLGAKDAGLRPREILELLSHARSERTDRPRIDLEQEGLTTLFGKIRDSYEGRMRAASSLDFDDLILQSRRLLTEDQATAEQIRARFAHVLVDEYQDTNSVQRDLLLQLVGARSCITAVGDPDQSIYRWRGAVIENILAFENDFPRAHRVMLEQNYRSTARILAAVEPVIARNQGRFEKRLFTERPQGEYVIELRSDDGDAEARSIVKLLASWHEGGEPWSSMAVFYRVNSASRALELALREAGMPYVVVAGVEFFQRREVKDILSYARLLMNPRDDSAFLRIVNVPRRGVGDTSLKKLRLSAEAAGISLLEAARRADHGIRGRARTGLAAFVELIDGLDTLPAAPVLGLIDSIARDSGYQAMLEDHPDEMERQRVENIRELVAYAGELDRKEPEHNLERFLERAALVSDQDAVEDEGGRIQLMSVHAAKGLEFPCVVVCGCELGLFPHSRSLETDAGVEEERRLFYVAMTRAMERLALSHASRRSTWQGLEVRSPSPFLSDIPGNVLEVRDQRVGAARASQSFGGSGGWDDDPAAPNDVVREVPSSLTIGDRVRHPHFGLGRLLEAVGSGPDSQVTVDFDAHGRKRMLLRYARLERLS